MKGFYAVKKETWPAEYKKQKKKNISGSEWRQTNLNHLPKPAKLSQQDAKRRIGHHSGTAMPPLMKK
jgi:hypothetical protein